MLVGKSATMGLLLGLGRLRQSTFFWTSFFVLLMSAAVLLGLPARFPLGGFLLSGALLASLLRVVRRLG